MGNEFVWVTVSAPCGLPPPGVDLAGLRAGMDADGSVWVWCGLIVPRAAALMIAAWDDEPILFDEDGKEFLRLGWMLDNLVTDEQSRDLLSAIERNVKRMALQ